MSEIIPRHIDTNEILVHFVFDRNFKRKRIEPENLIDRDVFLPNKGGVSLQRNTYISETECKNKAKDIKGRFYAGFIFFRKSTFEEVKESFIENREGFKAEIISSPLNDNYEYYGDGVDVYTDSAGDPAHADLRYINPAALEGESPKTAIRSFSRKLAKECELLIDSNPQNDEYKDPTLEELLSND